MTNRKKGELILITSNKTKTSGYILQDYASSKPEYRINTSGYVVSTPNSAVYYITIPEGANKLLITSNAPLNNSAAYQYGFFNEGSYSRTTLFDSAAYWREKEINIPSGYSIFGISISQPCEPKFKFI